MPDIIRPISAKLEEALVKTLAVGEHMIAKLPGLNAEALVVTNDRCILLREMPSKNIGEPPTVEMTDMPRANVIGARIIDVSGESCLRLETDRIENSEEISIVVQPTDRDNAEEVVALLRGVRRQALQDNEPAGTPTCPSCGTNVLEDDLFCIKCGERLGERCGTCGVELRPGALRCHSCGSKIEKTLPSCPNCGRAVLAFYWTFCPECGSLLASKCGRCGTQVLPQWKHCANCGRKLEDGHLDVSARRFAPAFDEEKEVESAESESSDTAGDTAESVNARGQELFEQNKMEEALACFRRTVELDPNVALYHCNLAVAYDELDLDDEAAEEYRKALELDPKDMVSMLGLGYFYSEREDKEGAARMWKRIIETAPDSAEAEEARGNLKHLEEL